MPSRRTFASPLLVGLVLLGAPALWAQDTALAFALKFHAGLSLGSPSDHLSNRMLGFGIEGSVPAGPGRAGLEVGWAYKPGDQYRLDPASIDVATGRSLDPANSADSRKNELKGLMARLSWTRVWGDWGLAAGIQVGAGQFRHEYIGDVQGKTPVAFRDTYNGTRVKGAVALSPYLGTTWRLDDTSSLEVQVLLVRYKAIDYRHQAGYVAGANQDISRDFLVETSRSAPHLEFGYSVRF